MYPGTNWLSLWPWNDISIIENILGVEIYMWYFILVLFVLVGNKFDNFGDQKSMT